MKKILSLIMFLFILYSVNAQVPQRMTYQAVIRDASNNLLSLKLVGIRLSIIQNSIDSKAVYVETHLAVTNMNGLISIQIGAGVVWLGQFSNIDWSKGPYFVKTETDPEGGYDFTITGTTELLSVPYALFALKSNNDFDSTNMHNNIVALQKQAIENKSNIQSNLDSIKANAKQIQINLVDIQNNTINIKSNLDSLAGKINSVDLDALLLDYQKVGKFVSAISLQGVDSFNIKINGNLVASRNVTVGGNIESLGATSTLGTLEKPFKGLFISSGSLSIASDTLGKDIPPAVLSNVDGNLQISAGGLKLMGDNTSFIAPKIVSTLTGNASTATKLETARKINGVSFDGTSDIAISSMDTVSLSNRINQKLTTTDTTSMLVPYYRASNPSGYITGADVTSKLNIVDTSAMLSSRIARDTSFLSNRINLKLNTSDTASMLVPYYRASNPSGYITGADVLSKLNIVDTSAMLSSRFARDTSYLSNRINLKLNTSGNQTLIGNLIVNDLTISNSYKLTTPNIAFADGNTQKHSSDILLVSHIDGNIGGTIDLTKQVTSMSDGTWLLPDGIEGQIIYFAQGNGGSAEDSYLSVAHLRYNVNGLATQVNNGSWSPFQYELGKPNFSICIAIFTDGHWGFSGGKIR